MKTIPLRGALGALLLLTPLAGCATYNDHTAGALHAFESGQFDLAARRFTEAEKEVGSPFLTGAEAGTASLANGDWDLALQHYQQAADAVEEIEGRALVGPEALSEGLASWVINDTVRAYEGEGFERVYLHCGIGLAYLALGKLDDVYVEARRSNQLLETEEKLYEKSYQAGGWGHLLSALAYELLGQDQDAYIDYQRMAEKGVGTAIAWPALVRLATKLGRPEERARWEEEYGLAAPPPPEFASVVLLAGVGLGPFKVGAEIPIPTSTGLITISAANFRERPQAVTGLRVIDEGGASAESAVVERVAEVARENLSDRLAWQVAKSVARGVIKREITQKLEKEWGTEGRVVGDIFSLVTEQPDLRAWLTLPDSWQAARVFVPPGEHHLRLEAIGGETVDLGSFELAPGETMFVLARTLGPRTYAHAIGGAPVEVSSEAAETQPPDRGSTP